MVIAFAVLIGLTFLPLIVLTRWTLDMKPGAGPQGGEVIFLGWLMVALWLIFVSLISAVRLAKGAPALTRFLWAPGATAIALIFLFWLVFYFLNHSSLSGVEPWRAKGEIWLASGMVAAVILANLILLRRAV